MPKASKVKKKVSKAKTVNKTKSKSLSKTKNTQKSPKVAQNPSAETATEDSFEGRTRRRRSAVTS